MEQLKFLGIGGPTNLALGGNCFYLKKNKTLLLIDICESATNKLLNLNILNDIKEVYIVITHTHTDHVAGLGTLIWYLNFELNIKPNIIYGSQKYMNKIIKLLTAIGVHIELVTFMKDNEFILDDLTLKLRPTTHSSSLMCYGIMFKDNIGKYYYTGDTNDIDFIRRIVKKDDVKKVYTEVSKVTHDTHILYEDLLDIKCDKLVLMHFDSVETYEGAKKDGFDIAYMCKSDK